MKKFLTAEWRDLVMANYEVDPTLLEDLVPAGTGLDLNEGRLFREPRRLQVPKHAGSRSPGTVSYRFSGGKPAVLCYTSGRKRTSAGRRVCKGNRSESSHNFRRTNTLRRALRDVEDVVFFCGTTRCRTTGAETARRIFCGSNRAATRACLRKARTESS